MEDASAMPLYDIDSLGSFVLDFGIGLIMHLFHMDGMMPLSKRILNNIYIFIAIALDETSILVALNFSMQNIYQSCNLVTSPGILGPRKKGSCIMMHHRRK